VSESALEREYRTLEPRLSRILGLDLSSYRTELTLRRLQVEMARTGEPSLLAYCRRLAWDEAARASAIEKLTIHVTAFFRDVSAFDAIRDEQLPRLLAAASRSRRPLRIWCAGAATGAEAYSVAMLMAEAGELERTRILATDVSDSMLTVGRSGLYSRASVHAVPGAFRRYLVPLDDGRFRICDGLRRAVTFRRHDLVKDAYVPGWDLVLCRNVAIYLAASARERVYARLAGALRTGGVLALGTSERLIHPGAYGLRRLPDHLYVRSDAAPGVVSLEAAR
jgi:chemotaxis protein methyltransferase CheR